MSKRAGYRVAVMVREQGPGCTQIERLEFVDATAEQADGYANGNPDWQNAQQKPFGWLGRAWRRIVGRD